MTHEHPSPSAHDPDTGALMLLTPHLSDLGALPTFMLYREGRDGSVLLMTMKEARNLAEELERWTKTPGPHTRVLIPDLDKPKKITRPLR